MQNLTNQADKFESLDGMVYLNGAFMSPQLKTVTETGIIALKKKARPYEIGIGDFFNDTESIRSEYAKLINCDSPSRITIIPSVSYGMANIAKNVNVRGKKVIIAGEQFPSNVYPWMSITKEQQGELVIVEPPADLEHRAEQWNRRILEAIDSNTAMVALSLVHWADGSKFDLLEIRKRTEEVGALLIIDGTQSVGAMAFDSKAIRPDALICAGYKWLLGPYGIGVAYYGKYFDSGKPIEENWINRLHSEDFTGLVDYEESYQPGALRFEVGEHSNFILVPMFLEALKQLNQWGPENIQRYCKDLTEPVLDELRNYDYWMEDEQWRSNHLFGIRHRSISMHKIKEALIANSISVSYRGTAIRVSPYVHNSPDQMNILKDVLLKVVNDA